MKLWVVYWFVIGYASALHNHFHQPAALSIHSEPHVSHGYAVPVQIYTASAEPAIPAAQVYAVSSPQIFTATLNQAPEVYATVAPAPQYPVHNVQVQSYSPPQYSAAVSSYSSQYKPAIKTYSAISKSSYASPAKSFISPQHPAVKYETSSVKYQSPVVKYQPTAVKYQAPAVNYQAPAVKYQAPAVNYQAPIVKYQTPAVTQYIKPIAILRQSQDDNFDGSFNYDFQTENGISAQASGYVKQLSPNEEGQVIQGQYAYTAPDGTPIVTRWFADETGFHAEGAHLPVAPPVPEAIAKSLAYQSNAYGVA